MLTVVAGKAEPVYGPPASLTLTLTLAVAWLIVKVVLPAPLV